MKLNFFRRLIDDPQTILISEFIEENVLRVEGGGGGEEGFLARFTDQ